jgi:predicted Rossmann fold flavoprotein
VSTANTYDAVVLGGGAAGLMCGLTAAAQGRRVAVVEHNKVPGEKIRISGGGRCNFTNIGASAANYLSNNPNFCRSALARYTPRDFIAKVERHGIAYHEKKLGQLFCDGSSAQIIEMLLRELLDGEGDLLCGCGVDRVSKVDDGFTIETTDGLLHATRLVIATGGLSIPQIGATPFAYRLAEQFAVPIIPPRPALVPFTWRDEDARKFGDLSGVSFHCVAKANGPAFEESALFTHRGLSGPAVLQVSSYWQADETVHIDMDPTNVVLPMLLDAKKHGKKAELRTLLSVHLTQRLAQRLCDVYGWHGPVNTTSDRTLRAISETLRHWRVQPAGTAGYQKAEVTAGGIDTRALDPKTFEVKSAPGLHFIGECVDVTGWLGGYNFQWAWASGHAAGTSL